MKRIRHLLLIFGLLTACASFAQAHVFLDHAEPKVGGVMKASPSAIKIWFTEKFKPELTKIQVFDRRNNEVDKRDARVDPVDPTALAVTVPRLPPGTYRVVWTAVCLWGHTTHGSFTFEVAGP